MAVDNEGKVTIYTDELHLTRDCQANFFATVRPHFLRRKVTSGWDVQNYLFVSALLKGLIPEHPHGVKLKEAVSEGLSGREVTYSSGMSREAIETAAKHVGQQARSMSGNHEVAGKVGKIVLDKSIPATPYRLETELYLKNKRSGVPATIFIGRRNNGATIRLGAVAHTILSKIKEDTKQRQEAKLKFQNQQIEEFFINTAGKKPKLEVFSVKMMDAVEAFADTASQLPEDPHFDKVRDDKILIGRRAVLLGDYVRKNPMSWVCTSTCPLREECNLYTEN